MEVPLNVSSLSARMCHFLSLLYPQNLKQALNKYLLSEEIKQNAKNVPEEIHEKMALVATYWGGNRVCVMGEER